MRINHLSIDEMMHHHHIVLNIYPEQIILLNCDLEGFSFCRFDQLCELLSVL